MDVKRDAMSANSNSQLHRYIHLFGPTICHASISSNQSDLSFPSSSGSCLPFLQYSSLSLYTSATLHTMRTLAPQYLHPSSSPTSHPLLLSNFSPFQTLVGTHHVQLRSKNRINSSSPLMLFREAGVRSSVSFRAQKRQDNGVGEDTDEMFDDELFEKYGKVVYKSSDQKPLTDEVDDDAESLSFAVDLAKVASDVKAADIRVLFVKPLVYWTRFFIIATAFSRPQIDAIGSKVRDLAEKQYKRVPTGDYKPNSWTLLDFGDVVIHIFLPPQREFYNLEEFYANATPIELPFDNQPPYRN